ncbi:MAG TPA: ATP-binding protein [Pirellulaceae bacterium]|nr:ATP-binding protein [Pirellulaceae bacterium]
MVIAARSLPYLNATTCRREKLRNCFLPLTFLRLVACQKCFLIRDLRQNLRVSQKAVAGATMCRMATTCRTMKAVWFHRWRSFSARNLRRWMSGGLPLPGLNGAKSQRGMRLFDQAMASPYQPSNLRRSWAPHLLIALPLLLLFINCLRGVYYDVQMIRTVALRGEMSRLHSQARYRVARIENLLEAHAENESWSTLREQPWMRNYWTSIQTPESQRLYVAIVDPTGRIVLHSDPKQEGNYLAPEWYDRRVNEAGTEVVFASTSPLSEHNPAYDLRVPIGLPNRPMGALHVGLSAAWLNNNVAGLERQTLVGWAWMLALAVVCSIAAVYGLSELSRQRIELQRKVREGASSRSRELAQLGCGLAHEIRNPLHALRINLHTLKRAINNGTQFSRDQMTAMVSDSDAVIDRLDVLLHDLVQFTSPPQGERTRLDVVREVRATLNLMSGDLNRQHVKVQTEFPAAPVMVAAEAACFRQALLNLLTFAQQGAGQDGTIDVAVRVNRSRAEIAVANRGLTLDDEQLAQMFDPFQGPAEAGSGLGLALVRCLFEQFGGSVGGESPVSGGTVISVRLPLAESRDAGVTK